MQRSRYIMLTLTLALGLGGVVACGGGGSSDDRAETITSSSKDAAEDAGNGEGAGSEDAGLAADAVEQALLTVDDMPTGYTVSPPDDDDDEDESSPCAELDSTIEEPVAEAEVAFTKGSVGPFTAQVVAVFPSTSVAEEGMDSFLESIDQCQSWEEIDEDGTVSKYQLSPMSFGTVGDQTVAMGLTVETEGKLGLSGSGGMVAFRRANVIELLISLGVFSFDAGALETVVTAADQRLTTVMS